MNEQDPADVPVVDVDPYSEDFLSDPYPGHQRLREAGPIVWIPKYRIYASARHEAVRTVFADHVTFISSAGVGLTNFHKEPPFRPKSLILEADPPEHTRARAVLSRILSRAWALLAFLGVIFAAIARKRQTNRHSSPPL